MKTYGKRDTRDRATLAGTTQTLTKSRPLEPENAPLTKVAYEWNNALKVAAERMWGDKE